MVNWDAKIAAAVSGFSKRNIRDVERALDMSEEKWRNLKYKDEISRQDIDSRDCALCHLFIRRDWNPDGMNTCGGCPIEVYTGRHACKGTPWVYANTYVLMYWKIKKKKDIKNPFTITLEDIEITQGKIIDNEINFIRQVKEWFQSIKHLW